MITPVNNSIQDQIKALENDALNIAAKLKGANPEEQSVMVGQIDQDLSNIHTLSQADCEANPQNASADCNQEIAFNEKLNQFFIPTSG